MRRLRDQLGLLLIVLVALSVAACVLVTARILVSDKRDYAVELASLAAPAAAAALGSYFESLHSQIRLFDASPGRLPSGTLEGVAILERHAGGKRTWVKVLDSSLPETPSLGDAAAEAIARTGDGRAVFQVARARNPGNAMLVLVARAGAAAYLAWIHRRAVDRHLERMGALPGYVLGADGAVLASNSAARKSELPRGLSEAASRALAHPAAPTLLSWELESRGLDLQVALARVPGLSGMAVTTIAPATEISRLARRVLGAIAPFATAVAALAIAAGLTFAARIVRPIEELTRATGRIARGDWQGALPRASSNEVGRLVMAFERMGRELAAREEELRKAQQELISSERLAALGKFSAGVAHEVKNPLGSILGYTQLLQRRVQEPDGSVVRTYLTNIADETRRASKIITDLLMFARQKPPVLVEADLAPAVERALDALATEAAAAGVSLERAPGEEGARARLDAEQMHQVLLNLVTNAIHAVSAGPSGAKRVSLAIVRAEGQVGFRVSDTGCGIAAADLPKIFEPFFSMKEVGKGTGLGLSICDGIVSQHRGRIAVRSEPGRGSEFIVWLPEVRVG